MAINFIKKGNTGLKNFTSKEEMLDSNGNQNGNLAIVYDKNTKTLDGIYEYTNNDTFDVIINGNTYKVKKELFNNFKYILIVNTKEGDTTNTKFFYASTDSEMTYSLDDNNRFKVHCSGDLYECHFSLLKNNPYEPYIENLTYENFEFKGTDIGGTMVGSPNTPGVICYSNYDVEDSNRELVHSSDYVEPWQLIETQLNTTKSEILEDKIAYGKDGVIAGTMKNNGNVIVNPSILEQTKEQGFYNSLKIEAVTSSIDSNIQAGNIKKDISILGVTGTLESALEIAPTNTFIDDTAKQLRDIQLAYDEMQPRILTDTDKTIDSTIYYIPIKTDGTPLLDTSQLTNADDLFYYCTNLLSIPMLDFMNVTIMSGTFQGCENVKYIGDIYSSSERINMKYCFSDCKALLNVPNLNIGKIQGATCMFTGCKMIEDIPELDFSICKDVSYMFDGCINLKQVPVFDFSSVKGDFSMSNMFRNCTSLTDNSLNNILQSLSTVTDEYTDDKTLKEIGLTSSQATKCTTLSNWSTCQEAGWSTGY